MADIKPSYLNAVDVYLYPSANAVDGGQNSSEANVRDLNKLNISHNYCFTNILNKYDSNLSNYASTDIYPNTFSYDLNTKTLTLYENKYYINGYLISIQNDTYVSNFDIFETSSQSRYIAIRIATDAAGNLVGDIHENDIAKCGGLVVFASSSLSNLLNNPNCLVLGSIKRSGSSITISKNYSAYMTNDADYIITENGSLSKTLTDTVVRTEDGLSSNTEQVVDTPLRVKKKVYLEDGIQSSQTAYSNLGKVDTFRGLGVRGTYNTVDSVNRVLIVNAGSADKMLFVDDQGNLVTKGSIDSDNKITSQQGYSAPSASSSTLGKVDTTRGLGVRGTYNTISGVNRTFIVNAGDSAHLLYVDNYGNLVTPGTITAGGGNDYAEWFLKNNEEEIIEPGTVICKVKGSNNAYSKSTFGSRKLVVGVCSDSYGHILGGENLINMDDNKKKYIPVALSGRVSVKVVPNVPIEEGDLLYVSKEDGLATNQRYFPDESGSIIGKALESSEGNKEKILMLVMLG